TELYCANGWWLEDDNPRPAGMAEATIFPIRQCLKSTPIRPVLDFRLPNLVIRLLDDLLLAGPPDEVESVERALDITFNLFGFEAPPEKRHTWEGSGEPVERPLVEFSLPDELSKRDCFRDGLRFWYDGLARGHADK
ncbi:hypothetical protein FOZ62_016521, partial [Perkinsus olseni]